MPVTKRKATGAHFTPPELARVVAKRVGQLMRIWDGAIRVLDPACGDGNLLRAMADVLPRDVQRRVTLVGIENDNSSFAALTSRNTHFGACRTDFIRGDFLDFFDEGGLFGASRELALVDVIVANPPYVRTQVLGAKKAQQLASRFELSGRVDLYQAFLVAMAKQLRPGGIIGVITSNRFMTTKGGMATRGFLRTNFDLVELVDLGDTKLFEAAVLPALVFARKRGRDNREDQRPKFVRIYENGVNESPKMKLASSVLDCLENPSSGVFRVNTNVYRVTTGSLAIPNDDTRPWTMLTPDESDWVAVVDDAATHRLRDVASVRVGIKTTADEVFVRRDWQSLPRAIRPEEKHLRPLLSQEDAAKWLAAGTGGPHKRVLYTHEVFEGRRRAIQFDKSSSTWRYFLANKERLESRKYVIDAGRKWYEIWVPQNPSAWSLPKIVFPDISAEPRFFLDRQACVVDGNCYWITTNDPADEDLLLLILGAANSSLMARYHDLAFQNKLYSNRRRHLTQYVSEYPLPNRNGKAAREIIETVRKLTGSPASRHEQQRLESTVDRLVAVAFDIDPHEVMGTSD